MDNLSSRLIVTTLIRRLNLPIYLFIRVEHKIVYTSAYVFEIDTVREAFKKAKIPFYVQTETLAGVKEAYPASPASGFGTRWHVFVLGEAESKAKTVLSALRVSSNSDATPFPALKPGEFKKYFWKALIIVSPIVATLGYALYRAITGK